MLKCSVTNCENPGTQLFLVKEKPEDGFSVCTVVTLTFDAGELILYSPGNSISLCPDHYDAVLVTCHQKSETDHPANEGFRELFKLNS
jgi:hypothetical protein